MIGVGLLSSALPALVQVAGAVFGASVAVRAEVRSDLRDELAGAVTALEVAEDAAAGGLVLALRRAADAPLTGTVPAGVALTVGAVALTVAQDARAEANVLRVALSAPLVAPLAESAAVTVATIAEFDLGQAIEQAAKFEATVAYEHGAPSSELIIPRAGVSPLFKPGVGTVLLIARSELPYADPENSEDPSPAFEARRAVIVARPLESADFWACQVSG